jgi:hypothetical protein
MAGTFGCDRRCGGAGCLDPDAAGWAGSMAAGGGGGGGAGVAFVAGGEAPLGNLRVLAECGQAQRQWLNLGESICY